MNTQHEVRLEPSGPPRREPDPLLAHVVYGLYAVGLVSGGIANVIGVIIAHVKRRGALDTWLETHYQWQIRTFWFALLFSFVGALLTLVGVGWIVIGAVAVWVIYRVVKGWMRLASRRPLDDPMAWI